MGYLGQGQANKQWDTYDKVEVDAKVQGVQDYVDSIPKLPSLAASTVLLSGEFSIDSLEYTKDIHDIFGDGSAIATYKFDGNATELSGVNDGTGTDVTYVINGKYDQAVKFNGSSSEVSTPLSLSVGDTISVNFAVNSSREPILGMYSGIYNWFSVDVLDNKFRVYYYSSSNSYKYLETEALSALSSGFHTAVLTFDSSVGTVNIDGVDYPLNVNASNGTIGAINGTLFFGKAFFNAWYYSTALLDQVRVFNRSLTTGEVAVLQTESRVAAGATASLSSGVLGYTDGKSDDNVKQLKEVVTNSISFVGVSDGDKYVAKEYGLDSYKFYDKEPSFTGLYEKQSVDDNRPVYLDNKWYESNNSTELVTNGTFNTNTNGWIDGINGGVVSWNNGVLRITNGTSNYGRCYTAITTVVGKKYRINYDFIGGTGSLNIRLGSSVDSSDIAANPTSGFVFTAVSTTTYLGLGSTDNVSGHYTEYDNISVFDISENILTEVTNPISFLGKVSVLNETPQSIDTNWVFPKAIQEDTLIDGKLETTGNRVVMYLEDYGIPQVVNNNRYVIENPFGNENYIDCDVKIQLLHDGVWFSVGSGSRDGANNDYGVLVESMEEGLVVQTAQDYINPNTPPVMSLSTKAVPNLTSIEARLIVTYKGKTKRVGN